jgi:hypothetical protein
VSDDIEITIRVSRELADDIVNDGQTAGDMVYPLGVQAVELIAEKFEEAK